MQETLNFTAWHRLLPTDSAIRSADDSETVRIYFKNSCPKAAPPNAGVVRMRTASAIGAEEMTIDVQATVAPRVGEGVVGGQWVNHVERAQTSEPERRPVASSELSLAARDDIKVIKVSIVKEDWAKIR